MSRVVAALLSFTFTCPLLAQAPGAPVVPGVAGQPAAPTARPTSRTITSPGAPEPGTSGAAPIPVQPPSRPDPSLMIGRPAPQLGINVWVKGQAVNEYFSEQIYVVEFWSRNAPACKRSEPVLGELQTVYKEKAVTIISVALMEGDGPGGADLFLRQYGDKITQSVGYDNTGDTSRRFLQPSGQSGIPVAFVIDGRGRIAWIGHPLDGLDKVLKGITEGAWDIAKARDEAVRRGKAEVKSQPLITQLEEQFGAGRVDDALATMDQLAAIDPPLTGEWAMNKFAYLLLQKRDPEKAYTFAAAASEGVIKDDAETLKAIAWMTLAEPGVPRRDVVLARALAQKADNLTKHSDPNVLDTLAKAQFESGDLAGAVETQKIAVEAAVLPTQKREMEQRLRQYVAAKKVAPPAKPG